MPYTNKTKVTEYGIAEADIPDTWIQEADDFVNSNLGKFGNTESETIEIDSIDSNFIDINQRETHGPIQSISSLKIDGNEVDAANMKIYTSEGYIRLTSWADDLSDLQVDGSYVRTISPDYSPEKRGLLNIEITGIFGWPTVPNDIIALATLFVVKKALTFKGGEATGDIIAETIGRYSYKKKSTGETLSPKQVIEEEMDDIMSRYGGAGDIVGEAI